MTKDSTNEAVEKAPSLQLLVKIGSALIHAEDLIAFRVLMQDADVQAWIKEMGAFLPVKRNV